MAIPQSALASFPALATSLSTCLQGIAGSLIAFPLWLETYSASQRPTRGQADPQLWP
uniref:Uncharacterized protein n=1 Tax=uncultured marine virus TaxID=186617 RepID=A0A0F7L4D5_9VIRU|nr:hypothetical protein [uncultured marine virus]